MGERNTAFLLKEWGKWVWEDNGTNLGMRSVLASVMPKKRGRLYIAANITDADALNVDRAVAQLSKSRPRLAEIVYYEFAGQMSIREIAKFMELSREEVGKLSARAVGMIDCALNPSTTFTQQDLEDLIKYLDAA